MNWTMMTGVLAMAASFSTSPASAQSDLDALRWKHRVLVLLAPASDDPGMARQSEQLLAQAPELAERDLVIFAVAPDQVRTIYGNASANSPAKEWHRHFEWAPSQGFKAVLVGKDGGVKWRSDGPFEIEDLNAVIDAMPMRRGSR